MSHSTSKRCTKCGSLLPLDDFYDNKGGRDGKHSQCKPCHRERAKAYNQRNADARREYDSRWRSENAEYVTARHARYMARRYTTDSRFRLDQCFRKAVYNALVGGKAGRSWESVVGYTLNDLETHLESQFTDGMTWDNYGEWHIDHIVPKSWFSYESDDSPAFRECWSLGNLKPMWGVDNVLKGNRFAG